jgi:isoleucyl-tRNA synthetase
MFRSLDKSVNFPDLEKQILTLWEGDNPFAKSLEKNQNKEAFAFYDGPPFATGLPHYGHLLAGTIKDIIPRYWSMKGKYVPRRFGWDCHGLPIESLIQNELELSGVSEISDFGIGNFNEACRASVLKYTSNWRQTVTRMGRWVDFDNDYKTMDPDFMESVWWVFQECWKKGLIYQGYRIQPYSPSLATPLSNFETNQGYKDRQDPSLTIQFPLVGEENTFVLVWTTTPWTLPSNMALAVGPDIEYVKVKSRDKFFWIASSRVDTYFKEDFEIVDHKKGSDMVGLAYKPLFEYMPAQESLYKIQSADFVSTDNGAGIVHIAPSFGEDDFILGKQLGLPLFDPLDPEGKFTALVPDWEGVGAKDADKSIIQHLKAQDRVFKHETFVHSYPHCYRTGVPLLYRALKTWFLKLDVEITSAEGVTKTLKEWMVDNNQEINWVPAHIKDGRFGKWLDNARDWNISRNRFWGTPLPVWIAEDGDTICVGSRGELESLTGVKVHDLHMHIVDAMEVRTSDGKTFDPQGKIYKRTSEVFDCWFESGSMPYAQNNYPFKNKDFVEANFPADFIAEGLDQTRGWFYTLTVLSAALFQKPAFKNVIVNGIILAEDGAKMSKSLRNYPDPNILIERTGADAIRLFMINSAAVKAEDLKFSEDGVRDIVKSVLLPLWHSLSLFITYANADAAKGQLSWTPGQEVQNRSELDEWILAVQQELLAKIEQEMQAFRLYNVVPAMVEFIDSLTNWYIRRSRRRFWKSEDDGDKTSAYATLYEVLLTLSKTLAPFLPFLSETIYQILGREVNDSLASSVHLHDFPQTQKSLSNPTLVHQMALVRNVVEMGRQLRAKNDLKNRQPLASLSIVTRTPEDKDLIQKMAGLILEELNIEELKFVEDESDLVSLSAKANFKTLGRKMGKNMKAVAAQIQALTASQVASLQSGETLTLPEGEVSSEDIIIQRAVQEGLVVEANELFTVAIDTLISPALELAGISRELVNRIQVFRKGQDFDVVDTVNIKLKTNSEKVKFMWQEHSDFVLTEVQGKDLSFVETLDNAEETDLNGENISFTVVKS